MSQEKVLMKGNEAMAEAAIRVDASFLDVEAAAAQARFELSIGRAAPNRQHAVGRQRPDRRRELTAGTTVTAI